MSCDHSGSQSGAVLYVREPGWLRLVLVCDQCGAVQEELGMLDYRPEPSLSAGEIAGPGGLPTGSGPGAPPG